MSENWTQRAGIALAEGLCDLGGIILAEGLRDWVSRAVPLFQLKPGICITTEEKNGKPQWV
jgi:hypothetical protein